jgi:hypothetical protein
MDTFTTVGVYYDSTQAHMARGALEAEGIPAWVRDEEALNTVSSLFTLSKINTTGLEIRLETRACDAEKAIALLKEIEG